MEFLQLEYFKTVARMEHMTRAAKKLNIAQPSLSKTIQRLEEDLGVPLFDREGRNIRLNENGEIFLKRVNNAFLELNEGRREIKDLSNRLDHSISIAILLPHLVTSLFEQFLLKFPEIKIQQHSSFRGKSIKQLNDSEIDFCISAIPINEKNIEWQFLTEEPICLSVPLEHEFANRKSIALSEAANESFISYSQKFDFRQIADEYCREAGFEPINNIEFEEPIAILRFVEKGFGIALTPQLKLAQEQLYKTVQIPIHDPKCSKTIGIAWNKNHYLSKAALDFKEFIIEFFNNGVEKLSND